MDNMNWSRRNGGENWRKCQRGGGSRGGRGGRYGQRNWKPGPPPHQGDQAPFNPVPTWEKQFCSEIGGVRWNRIVAVKKMTYFHGGIFRWNDSAVEEAFNNAKARYWAQINGFPCDIQLPSPDIYIDEIDWDSYVDPELVADLERELNPNTTIPCESTEKKDEDDIVIIGLPKISEEPSPFNLITGWGDAASSKMQEGETGNCHATDHYNNWGNPYHDQVVQDNQDGWGNGWNNGWNNDWSNGWSNGWNNGWSNDWSTNGWSNGWNTGWDNSYMYHHHTPWKGKNHYQPLNKKRGGGRWGWGTSRNSNDAWINNNKNQGCNIGSAGAAEGKHRNGRDWNQHRAWGNKREGTGTWTRTANLQ